MVQGADVTSSDTFDIRVSNTDVSYNSATPFEANVPFGQKPSSNTGSYLNMLFDLKKPLTDVHLIRFNSSSSQPNNYTLSGSNGPDDSWTDIMTTNLINGPVGDKPYPNLTNGSVPYRYLKLSYPAQFDVFKYGIDPNIINENIKIVSIPDRRPIRRPSLLTVAIGQVAMVLERLANRPHWSRTTFPTTPS